MAIQVPKWIVGGSHIESNHFPALLEVSFQVQEWGGLDSHGAILG